MCGTFVEDYFPPGADKKKVISKDVYFCPSCHEKRGAAFSSPIVPPNADLNLMLNGSPDTPGRRRPTPKRLAMNDRVGESKEEEEHPYSVDNPPNQHMDMVLFETIESIDDNNTSIQPRSYKHLQTKTVAALRSMMTFCIYNFRDANFKSKSKKVSGQTKKQIVERLVAFFYKLHLQRHGGAAIGAPRPVANSNEFRDCEIARLFEITVDPTMRVTFELVHKGSNLKRGEIDASNTNPTEDIWRGLVMTKYNNFDEYKPAWRYPDDPTLRVFDPNSREIRQRGPDVLKSQHASLRTEFSVAHTKWSSSGQNNPETWPRFIHGRMHLLYMWKILRGDNAMLNMVLRLLPDNAGLSSDNVDKNALEESTSRGSSASHAGGGRQGKMDAGTAALVGAIDNFSKGPKQASLYNSRRDLNREIMRLEEAVEELDDDDDEPGDEAERKKRGRKRIRLVTQLRGEKQSLVYVERQVSVMETEETKTEETEQDSGLSTPFTNNSTRQQGSGSTGKGSEFSSDEDLPTRT